ncbi:helix-turn-helix domain-containing protein [Cellulomonas sp. SG140]|uniref:helix-turn-helix domain-containing protein n=1 Tax=Cellulomonas sp. SG140 TaxID=2976536 RepID=UPI0021E96CC4|nr:helix-turn-helix domain-containing protein [Cellulomonas sp. SG140]
MGTVRNARTSEVARALGVSPASVQAYARQRRIPFRTTPGGQYRYNVEEVIAVLAPPAIELRDDLADLTSASSSVITDELSAYRVGTFDEATMSRLRMRGHHHQRGTSIAPIEVTDGLAELRDAVSRAGGAAVAVLHR